MGIDAAVDLVEILRQNQLLDGEQLAEVARLRARFPDSRVLAKHLIEKSWLTPYQINQLFAKRGQELVLGQYVLLERLGEGGMGQVFKAKHRRLDRIVALKVIRREHVANQDAVRRFRREIQASAQLSHPNIVMAYDADQVGETHFMVMEFVDGTDLSSLLKQCGPVPVEKACDYLRQAALGFQHAHEKGMVHRDVKPSNLLVTRGPDRSVAWGPTVKILDMGVARLLHPPEGMDSVSALTKEGRVVGTPDYMAPEQAANSAKADIRSDLYALGCSFFQMLTGQVPFPGGTPMEKLLKHRIEAPPAIEKLRPDVKPPLAAIIRKLMAKKPEERFQSPADVVAALDDRPPTAGAAPQGQAVQAVLWNGPAPAQAPPMAVWVSADPSDPSGSALALPAARPDRRRRWALIFLAFSLLVLGLAVLAVVLFSSGTRKAAENSTPSETPLAGPLKELRERVADPKADREALRRDLFAFYYKNADTPEGQEAVSLLLKIPAVLDEVKREGSIPADAPPEVVAVLGESRQRHWGAARCVAVHPESHIVASGGDDGVVRVWDQATMNEKHVLPGHNASVQWVAFTPDGLLLSVGADSSLRVWSDLATKPQEVPKTRFAVGPGAGSATQAISPDGRTLAVSVVGGVQQYDVRGLRRQAPPQVRGPLLKCVPRPSHLAFSAEGKLLAGVSGTSIYLWDTSDEEPKLRTTLTKPAGGGAVAFSADGHTLAVASERLIHRWDVSKEAPTELPTLEGHTGELRTLAFGPNGWLVSAGNDTVRFWDGTGNAKKELYTFRRNQNHWVNGLAFATTPPLVFSAGQDTTVRQWAVNATEAKESPKPLTEPAGVIAAVAASADGRFVAATNDGDSALRLWEPLNGKLSSLRPPAGNLFALAFGGDSSVFAAAGQASAHIQLWPVSGTGTAEDLPPTGLAPALGRVMALALSPDGKTLAAAFADHSVRLCNLPVRPRAWRLLGQHGDTVRALAFSPDGKTLASGGEMGKEAKPLRLWSVEGTNHQQVPFGGNIAALAFAPDGKQLATAGWVGATPDLTVWELGSGAPKARPLSAVKAGATQPLTGVAFTPEGGNVATSGRDGQIILMGSVSGHNIRSWKLGGPVVGLASTLDGRYLVTGNGNGTVYLCRVPSSR